jgi:RNA polymerase sigma-B factor
MPQSSPPTAALSETELLGVFRRYVRERSPEDRETLALRHLPLARHLARRYPGATEREDIEQVACLGLLKAIDRFDPERGLAFTTFAVPTILGEIKRYFRDQCWSVHVPRSLQELAARVDEANTALSTKLGRSATVEEIAEWCDIATEDVVEALATRSAHRPDSLDRPAGDGETETILGLLPTREPGYDRVEHALDLSRMISRLPEREREIVRLRFDEDLRQREIAERVNLSQMHVSRLLRQALECLRDA